MHSHAAATIIDGFVILLYFVLIVGIGLWAGRKNQKLTDFTVGGRSIPWWAVLASIIAAETSAATFLGTPAEGFKTRGYLYGQLVIGTVIARFIIAWLLIEPFYRYRVQSIYEFLQLRFGPRTRDMAAAIFLVTRVLGIGVRLYLGGVIFVVVWRYLFPQAEVTLATYFWGIVFVTLITTFYTAVGGIKAVVWTDLIQACLMIGSVIFALFAIWAAIPGGWDTIQTQLNAIGGIKIFTWGWDTTTNFGNALKHMLEQPYTLFAAFIASTFFTMATHGTDQDMVQRMLTAKDHIRSRLSLVLSGLADIPIVILFLSVGILLYVFYAAHPEKTLPAAQNEVFAHYIVNEMPVVIRGLVIAGVLATMMGSTSAALNALATSFVKDFYEPYFSRGSNDRGLILAARIATVTFGLLMISVATLAAQAVLTDATLTIIPIALGVMGYTYGALLAVFLLGVITKRRGHDGWNVFSMLMGMVGVLVLCKVQVPFPPELFGLKMTPEEIKQFWNFGRWMPSWWPTIAWPWYVFVGCLVTIAFGVLRRTPFSVMESLEKHGQQT
jgi:SSS family transporter